MYVCMVGIALVRKNSPADYTGANQLIINQYKPTMMEINIAIASLYCTHLYTHI